MRTRFEAQTSSHSILIVTSLLKNRQSLCFDWSTLEDEFLHAQLSSVSLPTSSLRSRY